MASMKVFLAVYFAVIASIVGVVLFAPAGNTQRTLFLRALFAILLQTIILIGSYFIYRQVRAIIEVFTSHPVVKKGLTAVVILFIVATQLSYSTNVYFMDTEPHWFAYLCYACLGTFIQLFTWLVVARVLSWFIKKCFGQQIKSRILLTSLAIVYSISVAMYGLHQASQLPPVKQITIGVKNLGKSFDGFKIVQISDIHLGPTVGKTRLEGIVNIVNSLNPGENSVIKF